MNKKMKSGPVSRMLKNSSSTAANNRRKSSRSSGSPDSRGDALPSLFIGTVLELQRELDAAVAMLANYRDSTASKRAASRDKAGKQRDGRGLKRSMRIAVTKEDITQGIRGDVCFGPIGRAIMRRGAKEPPVVSYNGDLFIDGIYYKTPPVVYQFIKDFNAGRKMRPFVFTARERPGETR